MGAKNQNYFLKDFKFSIFYPEKKSNFHIGEEILSSQQKYTIFFLHVSLLLKFNLFHVYDRLIVFRNTISLDLDYVSNEFEKLYNL